MRLRSLELRAYGHFQGTALDFASPGLHVVLGRNEAGKSTTLRAILGLLFGIDARTPDAHLHKTSDLRIGGVLEGAGGEVLRIVRRKANAKTLLDADGNVLDESVLGRLLGGVTRETFAHAWGLDHDRLGAGARALLDGKGDLGESLFDASTGGSGDVQRLLRALHEEADAIWRPRATALPLAEALKTFADAQRTVKERQSLPESFVAQEKGIADAEAEREAVTRERSALEAKRRRLATTLRRGPLERRRDAAKARLAELAAVTAAADAIAALRERQATYLRAVEEERAQRAAIERLGEQAKHAARRAGVSEVDAELRRLDARTEQRIQARLKERTKLAERLELARVEIAKQERELARLGEAAVVADAEAPALAPALADAQRLGDLEDRLAAARAKTERVAATLAARARGPLFEGTLDELVALDVPERGAVEALERHANELGQRLVRVRERRDEATREGAAIGGRIAASSGDFAPPDLAALVAARTARDAAIVAYRATPDAAGAVLVERHVREADAVADLMIREADRVTTLARLRSEGEENARQQARLAEDEARLVAEHAGIEAELAALFAPAGIAPRGFAEMLAWLERRAQLATEHARLAEDRAALRDDEARLAVAKERLLAALHGSPDPLLARGARLAELVTEAAARIAAGERRRQEAEASQRRSAELRASLDERHAARERDATVRAEVEAELAELLGPLGIPADATGEEVTAALEALRDLFGLVDKRAEAEARVRVVAEEVRSFELERARLLEATGLESAEVLFARAREVGELGRELATAEAQLAEIVEVPYEEALDPEEAERRELAWSEESEELQARVTRLTEQIGGLRNGLERMRVESQAAEAAATAQAALARIRAQVERYCRAKLAATVLEQEIDRYREENQAPLLATTSALFERLTLGAYAGVRAGVDEKDRPTLRCVRAGGVEVEVSGLSDGTRDQLHLSLRIASLLRRTEVAEPMPLVLDDVLIQLDDERAAAALVVLAEVARKMQVLFFTHHARLVELAVRSVPADELVIHHLGAAPAAVGASLAPSA